MGGRSVSEGHSQPHLVMVKLRRAAAVGKLLARQSFEFDGLHFDEGLRVDLLVNGCLVVELKSVEKLSAVHLKQLLTYLRLMKLPVGLLVNFGAASFKEGIRRVVNRHRDFAPSRLRVDQKVTRQDG